MIIKNKKVAPRELNKKELSKICIIHINATQNNTIITGTNIDNVYRVMEVSHTLTNEEFSSTVKLVGTNSMALLKSQQNVILDALNELTRMKELGVLPAPANRS